MPQQTATAAELKACREDRGLTLRALAKECTKRGVPVHSSTLWRIEAGSVPHLSRRKPLAKALAAVLDLDGFYFDQEAS